MKTTLKLAPAPEPVRGTATPRRGGLKIDKTGGVFTPLPHVFETTGQYRLVVKGKPGPWLRGPADRGGCENRAQGLEK